MKDNKKAAQTAIFVFVLLCLVNPIAFYSGYIEYELLEKINADEYVTEEEALSNDQRQMIIGLVQTVIYLSSIIFFLVWFTRAYSNLFLFEKKPKFKKKMAIWSFIIPIVSLYRPYQIMNEIWFETQMQVRKIFSETKINISTFLMGTWWALFIITNYVGNFVIKTSFKNDTIEEMINSTRAFMISDFLDIPAAIITIILIHQVSIFESKLFEANKLTGQNIVN